MNAKTRAILANELVKVANDLMEAEKIAAEWERPTGGRKTWRRKKPDGSYEYSSTEPGGGGGEAKPKKPKQQVLKSLSDLPKHRKVKPAVKSLAKVKDIMDTHKLSIDDDEVGEMMGFKKTLGQRIPESKHGQFYVRNEAKLKTDFIKNMSASNYDSPEAFKAAKERMQKMPVSDFGKILAALSDEEE